MRGQCWERKVSGSRKRAARENTQRKFWPKRPFGFEVQYREFCYGLLRSLGKICPALNHSRSTRLRGNAKMAKMRSRKKRTNMEEAVLDSDFPRAPEDLTQSLSLAMLVCNSGSFKLHTYGGKVMATLLLISKY